MIPELSPFRRQPEGKPRASGDDPRLSWAAGKSSSVNPARAGMIPTVIFDEFIIESKPRASGDDPGLTMLEIIERM